MNKWLSKIKKYLKGQNRFIIQNPASYQNMFALNISKGNTLLLTTLFILLFSFLVFLIISFTSIKNFIPGYPSKGSELYQIDKDNQEKMNELNQENKNRDLWIQNLHLILEGEDSNKLADIRDTLTKDSSFNFKEIVFERGIEDSILRKKVDQFKKKGRNSMILELLKSAMLFKFPTEKNFVPDITKGIEQLKFYPKKNSKIKASMNGVIINSDSESIVIQHSHNIVSVYRNFSKIKPSIGQEVQRGETLGIAKDSVFYFQVWYQGDVLSSEIINQLP